MSSESIIDIAQPIDTASAAYAAICKVGAHLATRSSAGFASVNACLRDEAAVTEECHKCGFSFAQAQAACEELGL